MTPKLLIYEPLCGGHRPDFIRPLVSALARTPAPGPVRFALPPEFLATEPDLADTLRGLAPGVEWVETPPRPESGRALLQAIREFKADRLLLLELTRWENFLCLHRLPCEWAGILFVQYPEIDWRASPGAGKILRFLRRAAKEAKTSVWLRKQDVRSVFLLNGARAAGLLNERFPDRPVFREVPDPAPPPVSRPPRSAGDPCRLLYPGALSGRKGCDVLLEALARIRPETARAAEFAFLGSAEDGPRLRAGADRLRARRPDVRLVLEDRLVPEAEFRARFAEADWILMPYLRPEYSSGILARAAAAGTPVLGPSDGLLGRLIGEWKLGRTARIEAGALAQALDAAVRDPMVPGPESRAAFLDRCRPERFAAALLGGFGESPRDAGASRLRKASELDGIPRVE